jgi:hypothetical protein
LAVKLVAMKSVEADGHPLTASLEEGIRNPSRNLKAGKPSSSKGL